MNFYVRGKCSHIGGIILTFSERIEKAANGDRRAYEELCAGYTDSLYTIAYMTLRNDEDARFAAMNAVSNGFTGISQIHDEFHLKAWLVRELTKYNVARLKEYKLCSCA